MRRPPVMLGRYEIIKRLGEGAIATVDLAADRGSHRLVALKRMHEKYRDNPKIEKMFQLEAMALRRIQHPNVVGFIDYGIDRPPYLVMEYVEGQPLDRLKPEPRLEDSMKIGMQVCDGLGAIHGAHVVHRDIKPGHILVKKGKARIIDLGYCLLKGEWDYASVAGHDVGTPQYIAPEQTYQGRVVDGRADVYSLGVILYELLSGSLPFDDDDLGKITKMHRYDRPAPLTSVPAEISAIVMRALEKRPEDRFMNASSMRIAIEASIKSIESQRRKLVAR